MYDLFTPKHFYYLKIYIETVNIIYLFAVTCQIIYAISLLKFLLYKVKAMN